MHEMRLCNANGYIFIAYISDDGTVSYELEDFFPLLGITEDELCDIAERGMPVVGVYLVNALVQEGNMDDGTNSVREQMGARLAGIRGFEGTINVLGSPVRVFVPLIGETHIIIEDMCAAIGCTMEEFQAMEREWANER